MDTKGAERMEIALQTFFCTPCGWQFSAITAPTCPGCQKVMQPAPDTRRKKLCSHEDPAQCTTRCFASPDDAEGNRKRAAA